MMELKALSALILVIGLIFVIAWLAKRYLKFLPQIPGKDNVIQVISARSLGPRRSVYLLQVEGHKLLVGSTESGITLLKDYEAH